MPSKISLLASLIFSGVIFNSWSQIKKIDHNNQIWVQYYNTTKITPKWSLTLDASYRWIGAFDERLQSLVRVGVNRKLNEHWSIAGGYAYFFYYPNTHFNKQVRYENRPWEQIAHSFTVGALQIQNRFRAEQRWFQIKGDEDWKLTHRFRYQIALQYPLGGKKLGKGVPYINAGNEIFFNTGKEVVYNQFDQNRTQIGLGYGLTNNLNVMVSYQYTWQQRNSPNSFYSINSLRVNLYQQLSLIK